MINNAGCRMAKQIKRGLNPVFPFPSNERPKPTAVKTLHWVKLVNPRQQCVCSITHRALFVLPFVSMSLFISLCATVFVFRLCIDWFYVWVGSPLIGLPGRQAMCVVQHRTTHTCYPIWAPISCVKPSLCYPVVNICRNHDIIPWDEEEGNQNIPTLDDSSVCSR